MRVARVLGLCWLFLGCGEGAGPAEGAPDGAVQGFATAAPVLCLPLQAACRDDRQCVESHSTGEDPLVERCVRSGGARTTTPCDTRGAECGCRVTTLVSGVCRVVWTYRAMPDPERCRANCESIGGEALPGT